MSNKDDKIFYKIIMIGDSDSGKKTIFKKLSSGTFNEKSISTIGMDNRTLSLTINTEEGEKEIEIQLCDTAGQERFRSITTSYYKSSQGILFLYDITKKESLDSINNVSNLAFFNQSKFFSRNQSQKNNNEYKYIFN